MTRHRNNTSLLAWVAGIYLTSVAGAIAFAWLSGNHLFDLTLTVSLYVGLYRWTSALFFAGVAAISVLLCRYVSRTKMHTLQRIVYFAVILCTFCCAFFPCNRDRSVLSSDIHDFFSYALALLVAVSFVLMTVFARNRKQRAFGFFGMVFAAVFIAGFALRLPAVKSTVLIWESTLIVLLFAELYLESNQEG